MLTHFNRLNKFPTRKLQQQFKKMYNFYQYEAINIVNEKSNDNYKSLKKYIEFQFKLENL